jgi:hypothetical protein
VGELIARMCPGESGHGDLLGIWADSLLPGVLHAGKVTVPETLGLPELANPGCKMLRDGWSRAADQNRMAGLETGRGPGDNSTGAIW